MGFASLQIGKSALLAANYGLQVTGQNISNVNTSGYSRQVLNQSGSSNTRTGAHITGSGVSVMTITNVQDVFANRQLRQAASDGSYADSLNSCYTMLQTYVGEMSGTALSDDMNSFWDSLSELSTHLETLSYRTTVIEDARALATHFNTMNTQLQQLRQDANEKVVTAVSEINRLAADIAELNRAIVTAESGGYSSSNANDLRDDRNEALRQLSEFVNIEVADEANGSCIVAINGRSLVYFDQNYGIDVKYEKSGDMLAAIPCFSSDGYPLNASSGSLAAQVEIRDNVIKGYLDELDSLAATFTWEFNRLYSQTRGAEPLDSATSLYTPVDPAVALNELEFKANTVDGTFEVVNGNLELVVYNKNAGEETSVNVEIDLDGRLNANGEEDMILWDPANPDAPNSFVNRLQTALDEKVPGAFKVSIDNNYKVTIESLSDDYGFCFGSDTSGILATLGMNAFFTGHTASDIGVNQTLAANPQQIGVANSFSAGDNSGILGLIDFRESAVDRLGGQTVDGYYLSMVGRLGSEALSASDQQSLKADILLQIFNIRESASGVNEDEEALKLMAYQRAYQSAARFISVVDQLYETLINM